MRLITSGETVREAGADEVAELDTATAGVQEVRAVVGRLTEEENGALVGQLYEERPDAFADEGGEDGEVHEHVAEEADPWADEGSLVTVKQVYPADSEYHGMPGLQGPAGSWLATMHEDLASMGIDPAAAVAVVELWRPAHPNTHYEVGAMIGGSYAKFDLTSGGYRLILGATRPELGGYWGQRVPYATAAVTAGDLYGTFLGLVQDNGTYDVETNDCERFAGDLCARLSGAWNQVEVAGGEDLL